MGMFEFKSSILLMFLVLWPVVLGYLFEQATPVAAQAPAPPGPFEYFRLALSRPPAVCTLTSITNCPRDFTIHGLWPDNHSGGLLRSCTTQRFVTITDTCLLPQLNAKWPNIRGNSNPGFWDYEWSAHGTCATGYTQIEYFTLAVNLKDRYANLLQHLNRNEIGPDRTTPYPVHCIKDAIQKLTTKIPDLMCDVNNRLHEIRICFNKKMATNPNHPVIDCPEHHSSRSCKGNILFLEPAARQTNTNTYFLEE